MVVHGESINYGFLLLAHMICADEQIHNQEMKALKDLAQQVQIDDLTLQEMEKILGQDEAQITLEQAARKLPVAQQSEAMRQILAIAYVDGFFSPLEREAVDQVAKLWKISKFEIEQMLEYAQGFNQKATDTAEESSELSVGARLLKGAESVLSKSLVSKLTELAPEHIGEQIERLQREILLSGPEYDAAIQQCAEIAKQDFKYAYKALKDTHSALNELGKGLQQGIYGIRQKTIGKGDYKEAKNVAQQLEQTRSSLLSEIIHNLEVVREDLRSKQRSLNHFSIAFMGRTKAGKSTLHAVVTGEGWESIGIGKQRTTRYNRVYEWKNMRIVDTPGIGAPGGKTDEEIARSVIGESDVICYVVTNDSIQESEFAFLKVLKEKTKPLIILLNIKENLRDARRLERFLKDPERWFAKDGKNDLSGHLNRIRRYAQEHYPNDYLTILPVMLFAAHMSQEPRHKELSKALFKASRLQDFLDSIRLSLINYGAIRRSQTLLGATVGSIDEPYQWISQQVKVYESLVKQLKEQRQKLKRTLKKAEQDCQNELEQKIRKIFYSVFEKVSSFAEDHWEASEDVMKRGWNKKLKELKFESRLKTAAEEAGQSFQHDVQEAIEEIGNELKIMSQLQSGTFQFSAQDSGFLDKDFVRVTGMVMFAAGTVLAIAFPPFAIVGAVVGFLGTAVGWAAGWFKSRDQKRREAVKEISSNLKDQLEKHKLQVLPQAEENLREYSQGVSTAVDAYFEELIQGLEIIKSLLQSGQGKLANASNDLNRAYAKRIVDWGTGQSETLTDTSISKTIRKVDRKFGYSIQIQTTTAVSLSKSQEEICNVLQERVTIQPIQANHQ